MKSIIFFGSDKYSALVLQELINGGIYIKTVVTTPPKSIGRNQAITSNPVDLLSTKQKISVIYYPDHADEMNRFIDSLEITTETIGLSASFPRLMPPALVNAFAGRLYNIHPSLLPQYRNVAPVPYAIAMGDKITGVSIFAIGNGIDDGRIVAQSEEPIQLQDTTPVLLERLFILGNELFLRFLSEPSDPSLTAKIPVMRSAELIFTRKLNREAGYIEWPLLLQLIEDKSFSMSETDNPLIKLRLTHHPQRTAHILSDLIRALEGYEKVWSIAETKKGKLQITLLHASEGKNTSHSGSVISVLISGKPKAIAWEVFAQNYL